jgi:hypothetical protein
LANNVGAEDGTFYAHEGPTGTGTLSQTFSDTPGQMLQISGWVLDAGNSGAAANVNFIFDGITEVAINMGTNPPAPDVWTQYTFDVMATGTDTFTLAFNDPASFDGLDNFSVTPEVASTPLPAALPLFATGLGALGFLGWRRKRRAEAA